MNIIDAKLQFNENHSNRDGAPKGYVLHHAAVTTCSVEDIHRSHQAKGWAGIGYHFFVRKDGKVYRGRPENWLGAHTSGYNDRIGICCEGNFEIDSMPAVQKNAVVELLKYLYKKYGILTVSRHRELDSTACPGKNYPFEEIVNLSKQQTEKPADNIYRVQTGAFEKKVNAEAQLKKLKSAGFNGFLVQNGNIYKIQVGAFAKKTNAEEALAKLKAKGFNGFITTDRTEMPKKSVKEIAQEVILGNWGSGQDRKNRLKAAGYDPDEVQASVNAILKG